MNFGQRILGARPILVVGSSMFKGGRFEFHVTTYQAASAMASPFTLLKFYISFYRKVLTM